MITELNTPNDTFSIYRDYNWKYSSDLYNLINFKYKINFDTYVSGSTYTLTDTFERYAEPDTYATFNLRKYLSTKNNPDYLLQNIGGFNSIQPNPIQTKFRLRIQEEYAYQFAYGDETHTGVSANPTKFYNLYNLRLTNMSGIAPMFTVGSVVEIIDNSNPITNDVALNGIYTVLFVGPDYIVINAIYDAGRTYFNGSALWSDHRQIVNAATTYTSTTFTSIASCKIDNQHIYTSLNSYDNVRINSFLMIPILDGKSVQIWTVEEEPNLLFASDITTDNVGNGLLCYVVPSTPVQIEIMVFDVDENLIGDFFLNIIDKCTGRFTPVVLYFLDRSGAFIPFYFDLVNIKSIQTTNTNWKSLNSYGRSQKNQIDSQVIEQYQLNTDWLSDRESDLFEELYTSNYIYMQDDSDDAGFVKVLISDKQTQIKKTHNNKLFNYQVNIEIAREKFINQ
jgi:hypothetical protein